jgi:hypothetical protein
VTRFIHCDVCCLDSEACPEDDAYAYGWVLDSPYGDLCPKCAEKRAVAAEHDLDAGRV